MKRCSICRRVVWPWTTRVLWKGEDAHSACTQAALCREIAQAARSIENQFHQAIEKIGQALSAFNPANSGRWRG